MVKSGKRRATNKAGRRARKAVRKSSPRKAQRRTTGRIARIRGMGSHPPQSAAPEEARHSKQADVIALLRRPEGATVAEVVAVTGWQPHTVRGLFSGTLKKKLGLALGSVRQDRGRIYRILESDGRQTAGPAGAGRRRSEPGSR